MDQNSCQTQELARTLGVIQQEISHRLIINAQFLVKKRRELICTPGIINSKMADDEKRRIQNGGT